VAVHLVTLIPSSKLDANPPDIAKKYSIVLGCTLPDIRKILTSPGVPEERITSFSAVNVSVDTLSSEKITSASLLNTPVASEVLCKSGILE